MRQAIYALSADPITHGHGSLLEVTNNNIEDLHRNAQRIHEWLSETHWRRL